MVARGTERSGAIFSACGTWRYQLWRRWSNTPLFVVVGLNPSTADETHNDPTITRCIGFAKREGYGGLLMLNLFALRATSPQALKCFWDPIGPENDEVIGAVCQNLDRIVVAWGNQGGYWGRDRKVCNLIQTSTPHIQCFGLTQQGHPRHPLYLRKTTPLIQFSGQTLH